MTVNEKNANASHELLSIVERVERLNEQKAAIVADLKEVKVEAKGRGFDVRAIDRIVKERAETHAERERRLETESITDVYRAALGMLDGTPLGDSARERLSKEPQPPAGDDSGQPVGKPVPAEPKPALTEQDIAAAKDAGQQACRDGRRVIDNPFVAGDPRRAAWDEGWCAESGGNGMDIPQAWRRREKKKPADAPTDPVEKNKG